MAQTTLENWSAADVPDQTGRVAVVTGANSGIGFETATVLAGRGATVRLGEPEASLRLPGGFLPFSSARCRMGIPEICRRFVGRPDKRGSHPRFTKGGYIWSPLKLSSYCSAYSATGLAAVPRKSASA